MCKDECHSSQESLAFTKYPKSIHNTYNSVNTDLKACLPCNLMIVVFYVFFPKT